MTSSMQWQKKNMELETSEFPPCFLYIYSTSISFENVASCKKNLLPLKKCDLYIETIL